MEVKVSCRQCRNEFVFEVEKSNYEKWKTKEMYIQDAMPDLKPAERELFISNTCGKCWDEMFGSEE